MKLNFSALFLLLKVMIQNILEFYLTILMCGSQKLENKNENEEKGKKKIIFIECFVWAYHICIERHSKWSIFSVLIKHNHFSFLFEFFFFLFFFLSFFVFYVLSYKGTKTWIFFAKQHERNVWLSLELFIDSNVEKMFGVGNHKLSSNWKLRFDVRKVTTSGSRSYLWKKNKNEKVENRKFQQWNHRAHIQWNEFMRITSIIIIFVGKVFRRQKKKIKFNAIQIIITNISI